jgi:hypothetical protein
VMKSCHFGSKKSVLGLRLGMIDEMLTKYGEGNKTFFV